MPILLFLLTVLSRLPFTSDYLYHGDAGQFALAIRHYDIALHQPHPPGYFLYVMLGKFVQMFIHDANDALILLSIIFSAFTVVIIYYLGKEIFDEPIGTLAAILAITSPNFWFHGEIAFTYPIEAFFSTLVGLFCWRVYQGKKQYLWVATIVLAVAGGFRQNTTVFLFPLWLLSVRKEPLRRIFVALALLGVMILGWFIPMMIFTGGVDKYCNAFQELWLFNTGHNSVFEKGFPHLILFTRILNGFLFFSLGATMPLLLLAFYALMRNGKTSMLFSPKSKFLTCWMFPSVLFYLLIFIHPANPGYVLILLPPLMILSAAALQYMSMELFRVTGKNPRRAIIFIVVIINTCIFLFSTLPVSRAEIRNHDQNIKAIINELRAYNPKTTALFIGPYSFYSYRHIMLYLPDYIVYQVDIRTSSTGKKRKQFGGMNQMTFLTENISPPKGVETFASVFVNVSKHPHRIPPRVSVTKVAPDINIVSGPFDAVYDLYPKLRSLKRADIHYDQFPEPIRKY